ncbi:MAG: ArsR/SmtB family transcription factor, partial [Pseudomonadota bacterium]
DPDRLRESADETARLLKTLANTDRLMLMCQQARSEMSVGELEREAGIEQSVLSQQLAVLRRKISWQRGRESRSLIASAAIGLWWSCKRVTRSSVPERDV